MSKSFKNDLTGQRFGRLTVLEFVPNDSPHSYWKCRCDCGNISTVQRTSLIGKKTSSCGCVHRNNVVLRNKTHDYSKAKITHGQSKTRIYKIWAHMKERCNNPHNKHYIDYGGRGIKICAEWQNDFSVFYNWAMANGYTDELTIDRIDNNKGYCPENCRWADYETQNSNKRSNIIVEYQGEIKTLKGVARLVGVPYTSLYWHYRNGKRGEQLFNGLKKK